MKVSYREHHRGCVVKVLGTDGTRKGQGWFLFEVGLFHEKEMLAHCCVFMFRHLVAGQLHSTACTAEGTFDHLQGTLLDMWFELFPLQSHNLAVILTLYRVNLILWHTGRCCSHNVR